MEIRIVTNINISEQALELLKRIEQNPVEYRDSEYDTIEDFQKSEFYKEMLNHRTKDELDSQFMRRNADGTLRLISELLKYDLVEGASMSWHETYQITDLGRDVIKQANLLFNDKEIL